MTQPQDAVAYRGDAVAIATDIASAPHMPDAAGPAPSDARRPDPVDVLVPGAPDVASEPPPDAVATPPLPADAALPPDAVVEPPPAPDAGSVLPSGPLGGEPPGGVGLGLDPERRDPAYAYARCAETVLSCLERSGPQSTPCVTEAPVCATAEPWLEADPCCAQTCLDDYARRIAAGEDPLAALVHTFVDGRDCMDGVVPPGGAR